MDPLIGSALVKGVAGLLGGRSKRKAEERAYQRNRPVNQVKEWEEAQINPLFGLSSGAFVPAQANTAMGDAMLSLGETASDYFGEKAARELRKTELEKENQELRNAIREERTVSDTAPAIRRIGVSPVTRAVAGVDEASSVEPATQTAVTPSGARRTYNIDAPADDFDMTGVNLSEQYAVGDRVVDVPRGPDADEVAMGLAISGWSGAFDLWEDPAQYAADIGRSTIGAIGGIGGFAGRALDAVLPYSEGVYGLQTAIPDAIGMGADFLTNSDNTPHQSIRW